MVTILPWKSVKEQTQEQAISKKVPEGGQEEDEKGYRRPGLKQENEKRVPQGTTRQKLKSFECETSKIRHQNKSHK